MQLTKQDIILFIFKVILVALFAYEAYNCIQSYVDQEPVTKSLKKPQPEAKFPMICISHQFRDKNLGVTYNEYKRGKWKVDDFSEDWEE